MSQYAVSDGDISIHALREEGDVSAVPRPCGGYHFYPRPPRGGRRTGAHSGHRGGGFLSTPSARRATHPPVGCRWRDRYFYPRPPRGGRLWDTLDDSFKVHFYPRPPRGGRPQRVRGTRSRMGISIHALREEGDQEMKATVEEFIQFLSTPSARRATRRGRGTRRRSDNFYPRPPRGGRQQKQRQNLYFQTNYTTFCTNLEEP